jgi:hypothetical protein
MTPKLLVLLLVVGLPAVVRARCSQHAAKPIGEEIQIPPGKENLPAEQVFHSVEILKGKLPLGCPK